MGFMLFMLGHAETVTGDFMSYDESGVIIENTLDAKTEAAPNYGVNIYPRMENFYAQLYPEGRYVSLQSLEGNIVILVFWASYDRFCRKTIPIVESLQKKYGKKGVKVLLVCIDGDEQAKAYLSTIATPNFPVMLGSKRFARDFGVWGLPTIYVLDRGLSIRKTFSGFTKKNTIEKEINNLL